MVIIAYSYIICLPSTDIKLEEERGAEGGRAEGERGEGERDGEWEPATKKRRPSDEDEAPKKQALRAHLALQLTHHSAKVQILYRR